MNGFHGLVRRIYHRVFRSNTLNELKARGLTFGRNFQVLDGVTLDWSHCWLITIGDDVTMAPGVRVFAHDASTKMHLGYTRIGMVEIGDRVFIGAASIVLPGVRIGSNVVIGAGSVVSSSIPDNTVACGNPAKVLAATDMWLEGKRREMRTVPCFGEEYTSRQGITDAMRDEMNERMIGGVGYVV